VSAEVEEEGALPVPAQDKLPLSAEAVEQVTVRKL
jgi:hypothetical protein